MDIGIYTQILYGPREGRNCFNFPQLPWSLIPHPKSRSKMRGVAHLRAVVAVSCISVALARNLLLTNDDGWAVAQIRAQYQELTDAGFDVRRNLSIKCLCQC